MIASDHIASRQNEDILRMPRNFFILLLRLYVSEYRLHEKSFNSGESGSKLSLLLKRLFELMKSIESERSFSAGLVTRGRYSDGITVLNRDRKRYSRD